jgi:hypothetical protein
MALPRIDVSAVTRPYIDAHLGNTFAHRLHVTQVAGSGAIKAPRDGNARLEVTQSLVP